MADDAPGSLSHLPWEWCADPVCALYSSNAEYTWTCAAVAILF